MSEKKKYYCLVEFPYPSGDGLHVGHVRSYTAMDIVARKRRRQGYDVLFPMGWDAFGLPTENYAVKTGIHPKVVTKQNTDKFREQLKALNLSFNWDREINTTDPAYYKWTQWIFLQLYKKGLAYKKKMPINWCPVCKVGLANEEVTDGKHERCDTLVEQKEKEQWMLAITKYADRLYKDLDKVDYLPEIKTQQRNWIGPSAGALIKFALRPRTDAEATPTNAEVEVFTTRPDTIFGVTFLAVSTKVAKEILNFDHKFPETEEKLGVDTGVKAVNPANGEEVPVWVVNYVLPDVGTGAVMGVPMQDERDREFAQKYKLPIVDRPLIDAKEVTEKVGGKWVTTYKLRDWVFSRQRYWGEPIPIVYCDKCGEVPVPEQDLPVQLPDVPDFKPREDGQSPLANVTEWVNTKCPNCGGSARRETDVMPNWAGSSWYYLAYLMDLSVSNFQFPTSNFQHWLPVDWYNGGMEHVTLHLLYSRFWHKFLFDIGVVPTDEPYAKRTAQGLVLGENGEKMSKSRGNVVNPDEMIARFGADALRLYEMFMGPFDQAIPWSTDGLVGTKRFLEKVEKIGKKVKTQSEKLKTTTQNSKLESLVHKTVKQVSEDIENIKFNTAVSAMMILANEMDKLEKIPAESYEALLSLLNPFAPEIANMHDQPWPIWDEDKIKQEKVTIIVQINGKTRDQIEVDSRASEEEIKNMALNRPKLVGVTPKRVVYVPGRLINIVT